MDKMEIVRIMAFMEKQMDDGKVPWVRLDQSIAVNGFSRIPVPKEVMDDLGLASGQTVNRIIFDAITEATNAQVRKLLGEKLGIDSDLLGSAVNRLGKEAEEAGAALDPNFDFRTMMDEKDDDESDEPTKH